MSILRFGLIRLVMVLVLLVAVSFAGAASAGPGEDELGKLAEPLNKKITSEFLSTPLARIVELLQRESGVTFIIDPGVANTIKNQQISLTVTDMPVYDVLELIAMSTQVDWLVQKGVVFVSTKNAIIKRRVVSRVYDIRGMLIQVPNYRGPALSLDAALSNTSSGGSNALQAGSRALGKKDGGGGALFGDDGEQEEMPTRQEFIDEIMKLVTTTAGEPNNWLDELFTITELNGSLVVRATPEVLEQVEQTLADVDASLGKMLAIEVHYLVVPNSKIDELGGKYVMRAKACAELLKKLDGGNVRRLGTFRTVCHNGQRVYSYAGIDKGFLSDVEPIPDAEGVDPTISVAGNGASMDIESTISFDKTHVSVAVRSDLIHGAKARTSSIPIMMPKEGTKAVGTVDLDLIDQSTVKYRTNVRIPDGGGVILSGATSMFEKINSDEFEVVMLLRTYIVKDEQAEEAE